MRIAVAHLALATDEMHSIRRIRHDEHRQELFQVRDPTKMITRPRVGCGEEGKRRGERGS